MKSVLILPRESLICSICDGLLEKPYECNSCHNLFCDECIKSYLDTKDKYRRLYYCPLCRDKKNNFCENNKVNDLINNFKNSENVMCKKCKCVLNKKDYNHHVNKCWYKCCVCHLLFSDENNFLEHFSKNGNHELIKVINKFNRKINLNKYINNKSNNNNRNEIIKREKFENNLNKDEDNENQNDCEKLVPLKGHNPIYDLYFCGKNNGINCKCCSSRICSPEGEICPDCMRNNIKYHNLKKYYLINKKGRACKYGHGSFHCYSKFNIIKQDKSGNYFKEEKNCCKNNTCEDCKNITELMNYYLPTHIIKKLVERDMKSSKINNNKKIH